MLGGTLTTLPFGEWRPDVALLDNQFLSFAQNVYPGINAYLPIPGLTPTYLGSLGTGNDGFTWMMLYFDGADAATTITDNNVGGVARTWTANGNAQIDTAQSKFGGSSLLLDGTGDYVDTPAPSETRFTNLTAASWDFFLRPFADGVVYSISGCCDNLQTASTATFKIYRDANNKINFTLTNSTGTTLALQGTTSVVAGAWTHIECSWDGATARIFVGGALDASGALSGVLVSPTFRWAIGRLGEAANNEYSGWIDGYRFSTTARHTSAFTPPTADYDGCRGVFQAKMTTGLDAFFAGTVRKMYKLTHASGAWADVTRSSGPYSVAPGDLWSFDQFGANVYATQEVDNLQSIDATTGTNFADVSGSPPKAGHVKTIGDFLVLSRLASNRKKLQWSAINDPTGWTVGTNLSDEQSMPDGGDIWGVCGDTIGFVMQERCIRSMQFIPGDTDRIFSFSKVEHERGTVGKSAFCYQNNTIFSRGSDSFYMWNGSLQPIGQNAVDKWFANASVTGVTRDTSRTDEFIVFVAPDATRVFFTYYETEYASQFYDSVLIYDYTVNKWARSTQSAWMWGVLANSVLKRVIGGVDTSGRFATLTGTNQAATIDTAESNLNPGMRTFVSNVYPLIDSSTSAGSVAITVTPYTREVFTSQPAAGTAASVESNGWASVLSSSRLHKFRVSIPAGQWTQAQSLVVEHQPDGEA